MDQEISKLEEWMNLKKRVGKVYEVAPLLEDFLHNTSNNSPNLYVLRTFMSFLLHKLNENLSKSDNELQKEEHVQQVVSMVETIHHKLKKRSPLDNDAVYILEQFPSGLEMLTRNKINIDKLAYRELKFKKFIHGNSFHLTRQSEKSFLPDVRQVIDKFNELQLPLETWQKPFDLLESPTISWRKDGIPKNPSIAHQNVFLFYCSIETGFQPSKEGIYEVFKKAWICSPQTMFLLHHFCHAFTQTNIFINSIATTRDTAVAMRRFFKDAMIDPPRDVYGQLATKEEKEAILYENPEIKAYSLEKTLQRQQALKYFGKPFLNEEEEEKLKDLMAQATPSRKKSKI